MSEFDDDFSAAARSLLARLGETIGYTPKGGTRRDIRATVDRGAVQNAPGPSATYMGFAILEVLHDADGVDTLTKGGDAFHFAALPGQEEGTWRSAELIGHDGGMFILKVYTHG
jgi:hypothetical protein